MNAQEQYVCAFVNQRKQQIVLNCEVQSLPELSGIVRQRNKTKTKTQQQQQLQNTKTKTNTQKKTL